MSTETDETAETDGPDETAEMILSQSADRAAEILENKDALSDDPDTWRWGRIHTVSPNALLFDRITPDYNHDPVAGPGGLNTVNVAAPSPNNEGAGSYSYGHGPSMRMVAEATPDGVESTFCLPGGQRHHRDSDYYDSLLADYLANEPFEMPFTRTEAQAAAVESVTFEASEE